MKLSTVVISYNEAEFLRQCLDSIINQKCSFDNEIIIIDDGSTDNTEEILLTYSNLYPGRIKYIVNDRNDIDYNNFIPSIRVSNNIKKAVAISTGEYIQIISADDFFNKNEKYEKSINWLEKHPDFSCYATNYQRLYSDNKLYENKFYKFTNAISWACDYLHLSCYIFRKEILKQCNQKLIDDCGLVYLMLNYGKVKYDSDVMFTYRQRYKSIMSESDKIELAILEILMYEDILQIEKNRLFLRMASVCRFSRPLKYLIKQNSALLQKKYEKYLNESKKYIPDLLSKCIKKTFLFRVKVFAYTTFSYIPKFFLFVRNFYVYFFS